MRVKGLTSGLVIAATAALLGACHSGNVPESDIVPVVASVTMDLPEPTSSPLAYFKQAAGDIATDDLVTFDLVLLPLGGMQYRGFTLDVQFDPGKVQLAGLGGGQLGIPTALGLCPPGGGTGSDPCDPGCAFNLTGSNGANTIGHLFVGVQLKSACLSSHIPAGPETLITIGFRAAARISIMQEGRIQLVTGPGNGDCEILDNNTFGTPTDLGIPFDDRNAAIVTN